MMNVDDSLMVTAAHRYCLGRSTYIVSSCIKVMIRDWDKFDENTQSTMLKDTIIELANNRAGQDIDQADWNRFVESQYELLNSKQKRWLVNSVNYDEKAAEMFKRISTVRIDRGPKAIEDIQDIVDQTEEELTLCCKTCDKKFTKILAVIGEKTIIEDDLCPKCQSQSQLFDL